MRGRKTGGRSAGTPNKATAELRAFAGQYSQAAITGLVKIARSSTSDQAKVAAWREILDRAVGKAPQAITDGDGEPVRPFPTAVNFIVRTQEGSSNRT